MLREFQYSAPRKREELLALLAARGAKAKILAGGTDLLVNIREGIISPALVVDLKKIPGFDRVEFDPREGLSIFPAVTINGLIADKIVSRKYPLLELAARQLGSHQVRNRATVIGNIANASPCADMAPPLLCLEAKVEIVSGKGSRLLPLKAFFTGVKKTVLKPDEMVERIVVPAELAAGRGGFLKLKRIKGHDLGIVSVALLKKGNLMRLAIGSAAPTPILLKDFKIATPPAVVCREALRAIRPIDDVRCRREYREFMVGVYIRRLIAGVR